MLLEPGPSQPSEMPIAPRVATPGRLVAFAAGLVPALQGIDAALGGVVAVVAPFAEREVGSGFNADVVPAAESVDAIDDPAEGQTVVEIAGALGYVSATATVERQDLPGPNELEPVDVLNGAIENDGATDSGDNRPSL